MTAAASLELRLPWPPSVNGYWRYVRGRALISLAGRRYRGSVARAVPPRTRLRSGRLQVSICACPPDRRKRDLDNLLKGTLDALAHAGVYADDGQIDYLVIERGAVHPGGGHLLVTVAELP